MDYLKIKLKSGKMAYALREYFPYTDKPFFKSLDDILTDESLQDSLAHLFVQLYKDELVFLYENITEHKYIVPIIHESNKFTKINNIICYNIAKIMGIEVLNDYFDSINIPRVDIRDEYTKENYNIEIIVNERYANVPVIIFDCCCSTGIIFDSISTFSEYSNNSINEDLDIRDDFYLGEELNNITDENLYLSYGIRFKAEELNNTKIHSINEQMFNSDFLDKKNPGYLVRIYGLFGTKNVEFNFSNQFSILIGENGYGKSTASRLALLALIIVLKFYNIKSENSITLTEIEKSCYDNKIPFIDYFKNEIKKSDLLSLLASFHFEKIEIYYSNYFLSLVENKLPNIFNDKNININNRVFSEYFGKGLVLSTTDSSCEVIFDNNKNKVIKISKGDLKLLDDNDNIKLFKHKITFVDCNDYILNEQYVIDSNKINFDFLDKYCLNKENIEFQVLNSKKLKDDNLFKETCFDVDNIIIRIKSFTLSNNFIKENGEFISTLIGDIDYIDCIPDKKTLSADPNLITFLETISVQEFQTVMRKIILDDRTIEIEYKNLKMKYHLDLDFNKINGLLREHVKKIKINNNNDFIFLESDLKTPFSYDSTILFDCTKYRKLIAKPPRDRIQLDYDEIDDYEDYFDFDDSELDEEIDEKYFDLEQEDEEEIIERETDEINRRRDENPLFDNDNYEDDEDNPYEDDYGNEEYEYNEGFDYGSDDTHFSSFDDNVKIDEEEFLSIKFKDLESLFKKDILCLYDDELDRFEYRIIKDDNNSSFNSGDIHIHHILQKYFLEKDVENYEFKTNLYSILRKIFYYNDFNYEEELNNNKEYIEKFIPIYYNYFNDESKQKVNELYNEIFNSLYDVISLGVYDVLNKDDYIKLSTIINKLHSQGLTTNNDYMVVVGLQKLIISFKKYYIFPKHILLEKLLNKYLINKRIKVYANSIVIKDLNGNFIPINGLSTGEKNLIIIFSLALSYKDKLIILDEPDISMSVEWQSKLLVDLVRHTKNKYVVLSQSPLLIQKNDLSTYVKRMEFSEKLELIPLFKILNGKLFEDLDDSRIINDDFDLDDFDLEK